MYVLTDLLAESPRWAYLDTSPIKPLGLSVMLIGAASDVLIAGFIFKGLMRARSGFAPTNKLVDKFVAFTIGEP